MKQSAFLLALLASTALVPGPGKSMTRARLWLAALLLLGSLGSAGAQTVSPTPPPVPKTPSAADLDALLGHGAKTTAKPQSQTVGWNVFHIFYCEASIYVLYVHAQETGRGPYFVANESFKHQLYPSCSSGNWVAFHLTDTFGSIDMIQTYYYK